MMILAVTPMIARARLLAAVALAAMSMARGAPAAEAPSESGDVPRVAVSYADLNLASPQDARRLLDRIADAAARVCGDPTSTGDLSARARERRCISTTIARAVDTVPSESLRMAYYQSRHAPRHGQPPSPRAASIAVPPGRKGTQGP
jgi:UrcA family protein